MLHQIYESLDRGNVKGCIPFTLYGVFPEIIDGEDVKPFSSSKETSQIASN